MNYEEIKEYWNNRALQHKNSPQATTDDFFLREIEANCISDTIKTLPFIKQITDIGCGDGLTTFRAAIEFKNIEFKGVDYSDNMILNAQTLIETEKLNNLTFSVFDITKNELNYKSDLIYTTRCLINLNSTELQTNAIEKIYLSLKNNGYYLMIENFIDGHNEFNSLRKSFDLSEIKIREHNLYFDQNTFLSFISDKFDVIKIDNISSLYYIVSRIIYSKICQNQSVTPNYYDIHHELGSKLPFLGNFGPVKMILLKKK